MNNFSVSYNVFRTRVIFWKKKHSFSPAVVDMFIGECAQVVVPSVILYSLISEDDNG